MRRAMLAIETSCDETAAAIVFDDMRVAASVIASQVSTHAPYGGVVPEVASRCHLEAINGVVADAMTISGLDASDLHAIAVTRGPGLVGSLLVGISAAKALSLAWNLPIVGVNHLEGHVASAMLTDDPPDLPAVVLLVSGGHSLICQVDVAHNYDMMGSTVDDSAGEAYDKVARLMGLGYPGGPIIDQLAKSGSDVLGFPRPMKESGLDMSFSGLKTAVANYVRLNPGYVVEDVAASFAAACIDVLVEKLERALRQSDATCGVIVGGVAASPILRDAAKLLSARIGLPIKLPPLSFATDNAAMIGAAGWWQLLRDGPTGLSFSADPSLRLGQVA